MPFPHYYLRMIPQWVVQFQGKGEIVPFEDPGALEAFRQKKSLRGSLKDAERHENIVFIKIKPDKRLHCYGLGISLRAIRKDYSVASYSVTIPS